jgi:hypothetical protein
MIASAAAIDARTNEERIARSESVHRCTTIGGGPLNFRAPCVFSSRLARRKTSFTNSNSVGNTLANDALPLGAHHGAPVDGRAFPALRTLTCG